MMNCEFTVKARKLGSVTSYSVRTVFGRWQEKWVLKNGTREKQSEDIRNLNHQLP